MNSEMQQQLPVINFTRLKLERVGTPEWNQARDEVVQALENYGSFEVVYDDEDTLKLRDKVFSSAMRDVFSLPSEIKSCNPAYLSKKTFQTPMESMAVLNACADGFQSFTDLMWPQGNPSFCETMWSYVKKLIELDQIVHRMIMEEYGVEKHYNNIMKHTNYVLRMSMYNSTGTNEDEKSNQQAEQEKTILFPAHTDPNFVTIIGQNLVDGVEVQTKSGQWVSPNPSSFIVFVSDSYEAWTNGRLEAVKHRVMGSKSGQIRYSTILTSTPVAGFTIQAPQELLDGTHPAIYKPFDIAELYQFRYTEAAIMASSAIKAFCGVHQSSNE